MIIINERSTVMNFKRIITYILLAMALICFFTACAPEDADVTTTEQPTIETEPPAPEVLVIADNGKSDFKVIRSEEAQGYYLDTAKTVNQKIKSEISSDIKLSVDWINPLEPSPEKAHEILLFDTIRAESQAALADLNFDGYLIRVTDCKVVIVGSSPASCNAALYHFFDTLIPENTKDGIIALPIGLEIKQEFDSASIDIGKALVEGKPIGADFEILFEYKGTDDFKTAQGAATDGKFAYVVMKKKEGDTETDRIIKIDMASWEIVKESEELALDHGNDMTYDPVKNQLVVTNMFNNIISVIDPETLTITKQVKPAYGTWATGYIDGTEQYTFLAYGTPSGLVITDSDFNPIRSSVLTGADGYIGQGMDADAKYAYVPLSPNTGKTDNIVQIYDLATGEYLGIISIGTKMESESMFHVGNDFYIHFNSSGSKIASLEFYIRFE